MTANRQHYLFFSSFKICVFKDLSDFFRKNITTEFAICKEFKLYFKLLLFINFSQTGV